MTRCARAGVAGIVVRIAMAMLVAAPVRAMSTVEEAEVGRRFALEARAKVPFIDDIEVIRYVERIGDKIVATLGAQPFEYEFYVVADGRINAFAVPGGYVYVHAGLLTSVRNEDELAGVLGHEVAHVHAHHLARRQEATKIVNYAALLGLLLSVVQPALGASAMAAQMAAQLQYTREFEQEADYLGARYMKDAGYQAIGMLDFFKRLGDRNRQASGDAVPPYLQTHPLSDARLNNLEAVLRERQWDRRSRRPADLELERVQLLTAMRSSDRETVLKLYGDRVEERPRDARSRYLWGLALLDVGRLDAAAEAFTGARKLGFEGIERELGRTKFRQRDLDGARTLLQEAVARDPQDPVSQHALGEVLEETGDTAGALTAFRKAVEIAPRMEVAQYDLGMLAGRNGEEAVGFFHLGMAYSLRGEFPQAVGQFERAREKSHRGDAIDLRARAELEALGVEIREPTP